jgi:hypothetical protein
MRFWAPLFEEAEWSIRAVLPLRSPLEVARSLNRRDGISVCWGCLLWLRHVLNAEAETRAIPRAVLDWSRFLDGKGEALARVTERLDLTWPNRGETAFADIDKFVLPGLRRHTATEVDLRAHPAISDLVRETYSAMLELVEAPRNNSLFGKLDDLRARFESAAAVFGQMTRELEDDLYSARSRAAERGALATQLAAERDALAAELAAERDALAAERRAVARLTDALSAEQNRFARALAAANSEIDAVSKRLLDADEQIARADAAIAHIGGRYAEKGSSQRSRFRRPWKSRSRSLAKDLEAIRSSVFFDERHYLEANPDVREMGLDAALHYLAHGALEGRDPGPFFSTSAYLARYPDVAQASLNPLLHYEAHGRGENRGVLPYSVKSRRLPSDSG